MPWEACYCLCFSMPKGNSPAPVFLRSHRVIARRRASFWLNPHNHIGQITIIFLMRSRGIQRRAVPRNHVGRFQAGDEPHTGVGSRAVPPPSLPVQRRSSGDQGKRPVTCMLFHLLIASFNMCTSISSTKICKGVGWLWPNLAKETHTEFPFALLTALALRVEYVRESGQRKLLKTAGPQPLARTRRLWSSWLEASSGRGARLGAARADQQGAAELLSKLPMREVCGSPRSSQRCTTVLIIR